MKVLLLGGTRFVGVRVSQFLANAGAEVTVFHRGITGSPVGGVSSIIGDRSQPEGLEALGDARFDAVLDLSGYFSDWTRAASEVLTGRVAHYVFVSSGAVYRPSAEFPWRESTPFGPNPIWGRYGEEKVESERILWRAYEQGRFAVTCFRFPFILGPGILQIANPSSSPGSRPVVPFFFRTGERLSTSSYTWTMLRVPSSRRSSAATLLPVRHTTALTVERSRTSVG